MVDWTIRNYWYFIVVGFFFYFQKSHFIWFYPVDYSEGVHLQVYWIPKLYLVYRLPINQSGVS